MGEENEEVTDALPVVLKMGDCDPTYRQGKPNAGAVR
jgi:hypothetical protein